MTKVSTLPPSGFRDFLPAEAAARQHLLETIWRIYSSHGFSPVGLSVVENLSTLQGKGGGTDNEKLIFKLLKRGEELVRALDSSEKELADLGLRFDLTLPLARYCARHRAQLPNPFKVFQMGPVWRADRPQKGRFREFYQCDVDIIGSKDIGAEIDVLQTIVEVFSFFGMQDIQVVLNDRRLLQAMAGDLSADQWKEALIVLDKLDKIGPDGVRKELNEKLGAVPPSIEKIFSQPNALDIFFSIDPVSGESLGKILHALKALCPTVDCRFDASLVRGQDYYTGTIFEIRHPQLSGSLGGGGRYNRLLEVFGQPDTPAFGGSIGFERLAMLLQEGGKLQSQQAQPEVFIPLFGESTRVVSYEIANDLRKLGLIVDVYPDLAKLGNQFKYADQRGIPFAVCIGESEWAAKSAKVKDMKARTEETVLLSDLGNRMEQLCNG